MGCWLAAVGEGVTAVAGWVVGGCVCGELLLVVRAVKLADEVGAVLMSLERRAVVEVMRCG